MANVAWNTNEAEWVQHHTGKGRQSIVLDYVHLQSSPANWIDYGKTSVVEECGTAEVWWRLPWHRNAG